jgi:hypothetical protein
MTAMVMMTATDIKMALEDWENLNEALRRATEEDARRMLFAERKGKRRLQYLLRIYGRFNRLRAVRERAELASGKDTVQETMEKDYQAGRTAS